MRLTPNVLYVEDDADTRELMAFVLETEGYQVVLAENCEEALLLARVMRFDLIIMDNWMPGGSGIELCTKLREFDATTPVIFYSGAAYEHDKREALACGAQAYLTKPTDNDALVETVARVIGETRKKQHALQPSPSTPSATTPSPRWLSVTHTRVNSWNRSRNYWKDANSPRY